MISGVVVGLFLFGGQFLVDNNRADREHEREDRQVAARDKIEEDRNEQGILLENLRFVRGLSSADPTLTRPFRDMDLHGLELSGLSLAGADFGNANLSGTSFRNTELSGASFDGADVEKPTSPAPISQSQVSTTASGIPMTPAKNQRALRRQT